MRGGTLSGVTEKPSDYPVEIPSMAARLSRPGAGVAQNAQTFQVRSNIASQLGQGFFKMV